MPETLKMELLEDKPNGLRRVTIETSKVEGLFVDRLPLEKTIGTEEGRRHLEVPGVYLLLGPPEKPSDDRNAAYKNAQLYVGHADCVRDRLYQHLHDEEKSWFWSCAVIKRQSDSPFDLSQCKYLESRLHRLAKEAEVCVLTNGNGPNEAFLTDDRKEETKYHLENALKILGAMGFGFFASETKRLMEANEEPDSFAPINEIPIISEKAKEMIDLLKEGVRKIDDHDVTWYWTSQDLRAKLVLDHSASRPKSKIFLLVRPAKTWIQVLGRDVEQFHMESATDLEAHLPAIREGYRRASEHLHGMA